MLIPETDQIATFLDHTLEQNQREYQAARNRAYQDAFAPPKAAKDLKEETLARLRGC